MGDETGWLPAHLSIWRGERARGRGAVVPQGPQRGRVRLRLELGGLRAPRGHPVLPEGRRRGALHAGDGRPRARRARRRPRGVTRIVAQAAREWCGRAKGSSVHVLFPRQRRGRRLGGERIPAARRLSVPLVSRGGHDVRRVPRALHLQAPQPDQARAARRARGGDRRRDARAGGAHARGRADDARALRVDDRQARRLGSALPERATSSRPSSSGSATASPGSWRATSRPAASWRAPST